MHGAASRLGWLAHPLWDVPLHYVGPGRAFAPAAYTIPCVSYDIIVGVILAVWIVRRRVTG